MRIGGLQKISLIDYPGKISCILFTQGCNFHCRYCHNPELVIPEQFCTTISQDNIFEFLKSRRHYLQGVVISGGEPTIQNDLISFLDQIKRMGYLVKLDTNGSRPSDLKWLINLKLVNYIAMDVKAPLEKYHEFAADSFEARNIKESIDIIIQSGIQHHFRTTVVKSLCSYQDLCEIRTLIQETPRHVLQNGRLDEKILDKSLLSQKQYSDQEFEILKSDCLMNTQITK